MIFAMSLEELGQHLVNTLSLGSTYALLALGLAMVFSILGLVNFAHGELVTVAGYTFYLLNERGRALLRAGLGGPRWRRRSRPC